MAKLISDEVVNQTAITNEDKAKKIEALLMGTGAENFRLLEQKISQFCPFEAIGMVRQEIKHAHFLSFILDPNRPHPFKDNFFESFFVRNSSPIKRGADKFATT